MTPVRILCVDDKEEILAALRSHLARADGMDVVGTSCTTAGLAATIENTKPDILVLDLDMPGESPLEVLRDVSRANGPLRTVMFSGHIRRELVDQAMDAGAWGYVSKNDGENLLVAAIRMVMAGEIAWSPEVRSILSQR